MAETRNVADVLNELNPDEMNERIAELEKEIAVKEAEISSIRVLLKAVNIARNGKPTRKPRKRKEKPPAAPENEPKGNGVKSLPTEPTDRVVEYLRVQGPAAKATIQRHCGLNESQVNAAVADRRIKQTGSGLFQYRG